MKQIIKENNQMKRNVAKDNSEKSTTYQTQCKVEQRGATVEQDSEQRRGGGDEETHVPAHHHPQRLQNLQKNHQSISPLDY